VVHHQNAIFAKTAPKAFHQAVVQPALGHCVVAGRAEPSDIASYRHNVRHQSAFDHFLDGIGQRS
jgi:hypothetical protein